MPANDKGFVVNDEARTKLKNWYEVFRGHVMSPTTERTLETRHGRTHVTSAGPEDAPPIVMLHGAMATSAHVLCEAGPLVKRYRVHAIDVLGQSYMSEERRLSLKDATYAEWLSDVFDGLGLKSATVFGISWGGFVALRGLAKLSERIERLVLLVPAGVVNGSAWTGFSKVAWPMMMYRMFPSDERLKRFFMALFTTWDDDWARYLADSMKLMKTDLRVPPLFGPSDVASFDKPVLVIGAEQDASFPGAALVARAKELFPQAETELLPGAKHGPSTTPQARAALADRVSRFIDGPS